MYNNYYVPQTVSMPMALYKSLQGRYFAGYSDTLDFGQGLCAWAGLVNPEGSGVNIFVSGWTITSLCGAFSAQVWFNAQMPGETVVSPHITTSNFTIHPLPEPKAVLMSASNVSGEPQGGIKAFAHCGAAGSAIIAREEGKFIFPPGGSFSISLSGSENPEEKASVRAALEWWEEPARSYH